MENSNQETTTGQQTINIQVPTADNLAGRRPLIQLLFAFAVILFFFNFFTISCQDQKIGDVKGIDLVTGTEIKSQDLFTGEDTEGEKIPPNIWAIIAFGAGILGFGVYLMKEKNESILGAVTGSIGVGALLILQMAINKAMEKEGEGMIETKFHFAYWGALVAFGIAAYLSYLRYQKGKNQVFQAYSSPTIEQKNENIVQPVSENVNPPKRIDIGGLLRKNIKYILGLVGLGIVLFAVYFFFLKPNPAKDAKIISYALCDCTKNWMEERIKINEYFIKSFEQYNFKNRKDARDKLEELNNPGYEEYSECTEKATQNYNELRNKYIDKPKLLEKFDLTHTAQADNCDSKESQLSSLNEVIEDKILSIKIPEPDIENIKNDLLGRHMLGWNFDALSEFKEVKIVNTTQGSERIEYTLDLKLEGYLGNNKHDAQIIVFYTKDYDNWYFNDIKPIYITYEYLVESESWTEIIPLQNCYWNFGGEHKIVWKTGPYSPEILSGPDQLYAKLPTLNRYLVKSREGRPVTIKLTYKPYN